MLSADVLRPKSISSILSLCWTKQDQDPQGFLELRPMPEWRCDIESQCCLALERELWKRESVLLNYSLRRAFKTQQIKNPSVRKLSRGDLLETSSETFCW